MHIKKAGFLACLFQFVTLCPSSCVAAEDKPEPKSKPCTIHSPNTGAYFDLNTISLLPPEIKDGKKVRPDDREDSWHARGYDYGANFTINVCAPAIEKLDDVVGVDKQQWQNVSAFYKMDGKTYSIGQQASDLVFRGRKLVLNYTDGSPCPTTSDKNRRKRNPLPREDEDDEDEDKGRESNPKEQKRKSTIMSFLCDRDLVTPAAAVSYVGTLDSCTYFFEVRSAAACGGVAASTDGGVGPAGVFGIIGQSCIKEDGGSAPIMPYGMDMVIILFSSILSCFKSREGYTRVSLGQDNNNNGGGTHRRGLVGAIGGRGSNNHGTTGRGRRHDVDEENRLIDQLDEEWDD
ncbi:Cation-independent mannose-6-phosphate receptor CI-MPR [Emydomyces testavorans]|uniref:Cation-independent mannose-6-phosphate receptor CI-MPR n=1 Tax=Emydomyces testavorans TaxID=2070801 RepID=A0AAF0IFX4_9EURO|nr:Cation-independent mannose-6-phosphate receptor CI-MPR [Emydomyces testavorans]